jgi:hypothetical protein
VGASDCAAHVIHGFFIGLALRGAISPLSHQGEGCCEQESYWMDIKPQE